MAIDDVSVGMAVKNSILFALLVLIAHYAIRNIANSSASDRDGSGSDGSDSSGGSSSDGSVDGTKARKTVTFALDKNIEIDPPHADRISPKPDPLYEYVFGDGIKGGDSGLSIKPVSKASTADPKAPPAAGDHRGCMVVGQYSNENELCGGKLFDTGLQGHDGVYSMSYSSWA